LSRASQPTSPRGIRASSRRTAASAPSRWTRRRDGLSASPLDPCAAPMRDSTAWPRAQPATRLPLVPAAGQLAAPCLMASHCLFHIVGHARLGQNSRSRSLPLPLLSAAPSCGHRRREPSSRAKPRLPYCSYSSSESTRSFLRRRTPCIVAPWGCAAGHPPVAGWAPPPHGEGSPGATSGPAAAPQGCRVGAHASSRSPPARAGRISAPARPHSR
jgi:hypothetical protein